MRTRLAYCLLACAVIACDDDAPGNDSDTTAATTTPDATIGDTTAGDTSEAGDTTEATADDTTVAEVEEDTSAEVEEDTSAEVEEDTVTAVEPFVAFTVKVIEQLDDGQPVVTDAATCLPDGAAYMSFEAEPTYGDILATGCTLGTSQGVVKIAFRALGLAPELGLTDAIPADRPPRLVASASKPGVWGTASGTTGFDARIRVLTYDDVARVASGTLSIKQQPVVGATLKNLTIEGTWSGAW